MPHIKFWNIECILFPTSLPVIPGYLFSLCRNHDCLRAVIGGLLTKWLGAVTAIAGGIFLDYRMHSLSRIATSGGDPGAVTVTDEFTTGLFSMCMPAGFYHSFQATIFLA